MLQKIEFKKEI